MSKTFTKCKTGQKRVRCKPEKLLTNVNKICKQKVRKKLYLLHIDYATLLLALHFKAAHFRVLV